MPLPNRLNISTGTLFAALVGSIIITFVFLNFIDEKTVIDLPLVAIGGMVVLISMLTAVAIIFRYMGLANSNRAMVLPDGSIAAVIALPLIVSFAVFAVFLYRGVLKGRKAEFSALSDLKDGDVCLWRFVLVTRCVLRG